MGITFGGDNIFPVINTKFPSKIDIYEEKN